MLILFQSWRLNTVAINIYFLERYSNKHSILMCLDLPYFIIFDAIACDAEGLFLALRSGIIPVGYGGPCTMIWIKPRSAECKASTLHAVLPATPFYLVSLDLCLPSELLLNFNFYYQIKYV